MDKPMGKLTLEEVQTWCKENDDCPGCPCYTKENGCIFASCAEASEWPLNTEQEDPPAADDTNVGHKPAKPRLTEVLGVDENEPIRVVGGGYDTVPFTIADVTVSDGRLMAGAVTYAIIHPESIIRAPRLTEAELSICKAAGAKWVSRDALDFGVQVSLWMERPGLIDGFFCGAEENKNYGWMGNIATGLFPNIHPGDCICVEEAHNDD